MRNFRPLFLGILLVGTLAAALSAVDRPLVLYNHTPSLPLGWYAVTTTPGTGEAVAVFPVPSRVQALVAERRWLPDGAFLSKPVGAQAGDHVCIRDRRIYVNGSDFGAVQASDSKGRPMPTVDYCGAVPDGYFWALIAGRSDSFDSRYIGAIDTHSIVGYARALWTWPASS